MTYHHRLPLFVITAALGTPAFAQADNAPDGDDIVVTAQANNATEVFNGGNAGVLGNVPAEDLAFSIRSYGEELILNQQPQTLGEVLDNDPTVRTTYGFGNAAEQFVIRGFPLFGDDVGVNGLYGIAPRQLIAPELFDSVQVLNGASAFLNGVAPGGSGLGGSVNLLLKRAGDDALSRATLGYNSGSVFGGSFDVARRFGSNNEWGVRINGAWREGETAIDREDRRTQVLGGAIDYRGDGVRLALDLGWQNVRVDALRAKVTVGTAIPAVPAADANYAQNYTFSELRDVFATFSAEVDLADNALFYARGGFRDGREDGIYGGITVTNATTGAANGNALIVPRTDNNEAAEAGLRIRLGSAVTHQINVGANINWQVNRNAFDFRYGPGFAGFATNLYAPVQTPILSSSFVGGNLADPFPISRTRLWSVFASDTVGLFNDRVLLTAGLRLQTIRVASYNYYNGGQLDTVYDENVVTPVIGIVIQPTETLSLYANRIEALQQGPTAPIDPLIANAGEVLAPYRSVQYEIGAKLRLGDLFATLAAYQIERPSAFAAPNGSGQQIFGLFGEQRNRGLEFTVNGEVAPGLRVIAGVAHNDAELTRTQGGIYQGRSISGVPDWTANANVEWDLPFAPGLTLTGRATHSGEQFLDSANTLSLSDWTVFDLGARYVFATGNTPITLRLTVDNVANNRYWASAFDAFSPALLQGRPRTVNASVSMNF